MYGPTETTIWSSTYKVTNTKWVTAPIGRPIANTQIYVLDDRRRPQPVGVAGEIFIGGDGVARGYWNRPDLTPSRFVADPFRGPGTRLYKTGDLGRYLPDGSVQYLGRTDTQVKVRGFRIELGEIEGILAQYPGVQQAAAAINEENGDKRIVGYLVGDEHKLKDLEELSSFLRQKLPDYMLPSRFVILQRLPLTPNGKLDRKSLPAPTREVISPCRRAPQDNIETQLVAIFESVLGVRPVGVTDDFFRLGGHSLMAVQVIARIRKAFAVELPVRTVFEEPTVVGIADEVRKSLAAGEKMRTPTLQVRPRSAAAAASADDFLGELERLPNGDAQLLLQRILQGKQSA
jgi:acyl carrier protein